MTHDASGTTGMPTFYTDRSVVTEEKEDKTGRQVRGTETYEGG